jgi:hypothetical protein
VTVRAVSWPAVLAGSALTVLLTLLSLAVPSSFPAASWVALAGVAGAAAFVLDDGAAAVVDATPYPLRRRTVARSTATVLPLAVWTGCVLLLDARYPETPSWLALLAGAASMAAGVAAAAVARRAGWAEPGELVSLSLGGLLIGAALLPPAIREVTPYDPRPAAATWWTVLAGLAAVTLTAAVRDPVAPRPRRATAARTGRAVK